MTDDAMDYDPQPCPECAVLKCGNCDGSTWDVLHDRPAPCPCAEAGHDAKRTN